MKENKKTAFKENAKFTEAATGGVKGVLRNLANSQEKPVPEPLFQ